jgi:hypothetical protein
MYILYTDFNDQYDSYMIIFEAAVSYIHTLKKAQSFFCPSSHRTISIALS